MLFSRSKAKPPRRNRPTIAFFDYPDVFEDFYPKYGVDQHSFATSWAASGNHAFLSVLQNEIGDVTWYAFSLKPQLEEATHEVVGCKVKFFRSSFLHRCLWNLFYLPRPAWRWRRFYRVYATMASYVALLSGPFLKTLLSDRPDCIFVQDYASGRYDVLVLMARWLKIPLFAYHAGSRPAGYVGRWAKHWTIPRAKMLVVSSKAEAEMLSTRYHVPRERLKVVLTPIDTEIFKPLERTEACMELALSPDRRYLLFVGRLDDPVKRISAIVESFSRTLRKHKDVDLLIGGSGPDEKALEQLAADLAPDHVRFLGWIDSAREKALLYNSAECLLLPSIKEGFPTVVGEAMACGTPILASDLEGIAELVEPGKTGWLVQPGNDEELAAALEFVVDNEATVRSMRALARTTAVNHLSPQAVARQLRSCFFPDRKESPILNLNVEDVQ